MPLYFVTTIVKGSRHQEIGVSSQGRAGSMLGITKAPANWIVYLIMIVCSIDRLCRVYLVKSQHPTGQKGIRWRAALPLTPIPATRSFPKPFSPLRLYSPTPTRAASALQYLPHILCVYMILSLPQEEKGVVSLLPPAPASTVPHRKSWGTSVMFWQLIALAALLEDLVPPWQFTTFYL